MKSFLLIITLGRDFNREHIFRVVFRFWLFTVIQAL